MTHVISAWLGVLLVSDFCAIEKPGGRFHRRIPGFALVSFHLVLLTHKGARDISLVQRHPDRYLYFESE